MKSYDVPYPTDEYQKDYSFEELFNRVKPNKNADWKDIYKSPGVYVIYFTNDSQPFFTKTSKISNTNSISPFRLKQKWKLLNNEHKTDILYIGKGKNLRKRIRALIRFGHGKSNKHYGGEWIWQIENISDLRLLISSCPINQEGSYENWLLNTFKKDHHDWPLCNRIGGSTSNEWFPN